MEEVEEVEEGGQQTGPVRASQDTWDQHRLEGWLLTADNILHLNTEYSCTQTDILVGGGVCVCVCVWGGATCTIVIFDVLFVIMFLFVYNSNHSTKLPDSERHRETGKEIDGIIDGPVCARSQSQILNAHFASFPRGAVA